MNKRSVGAIGLLIGCGGDSTALTYIAPLDGQTAVGAQVELQVFSPDLEFPADYPTSQLFLVVDLQDGGLVPGTFTVHDDYISFSPDGGWPANRDFAWALDASTGVAHGPTLGVPEGLDRIGLFSTQNTLIPLGAGVDDTGSVCLPLSRTLAPEANLSVQLTVNDAPRPQATVRVERDSQSPYELQAGDAGIDVLCVDDTDPIVAGDVLRLWLNEAGPWQFEVQQSTPQQLITALRWGDAG